VRACVYRGSGGRSQWADVKSQALSVRSVCLVCFFLALRNQLGDVVRPPPSPHARAHTHTHTNTQVANQQQARLAYLGRGDTSVHVQDTMVEAGSAGSVMRHDLGGEKEEKTEEERGGDLVSTTGGADAGVAVAVPGATHDAALCFRVV